MFNKLDFVVEGADIGLDDIEVESLSVISHNVVQVLQLLLTAKVVIACNLHVFIDVFIP